MRFALPAGLALAIMVPASAAHAQAGNPEDEPIVDQPVAPVAPKTPTPATPTAPAVTPPLTPGPDAPTKASNKIPPPTVPADTVTVPRAVWEQLLKDVEDLKRNHAAQQTASTTVPATTSVTQATIPTPGGSTTTTNRNYLLLPDISFIGSGTGLASSDKRSDDRNSLNLEGELAIQGFVYPGVKFDTFIVGNPGEDEAFNIEEGYITLQSAMKGLDINVGRKFAAFGRTGEQHPHSWLYTDQVLPRKALVAPENLVGNGVQFNYLIPTPKSYFARASFGVFGNGEGEDVRVNQFDPSDPFEGGAVSRPGAALSRFYSGRLWLGKSFGDATEAELGFSAARGRSAATAIVDDGTGNPMDQAADGRVNLTGVDFSLRRYTGVNGRLLFRSEFFKYNPRDLPTTSANGYYALVNWRPNRYYDWGLLYERTGLPTAAGDKESGLSLIYTKRLTEQYLVRATGTRGSRPGVDNYNELRLQFIAGIGPHTHNLE